MKCTVYYVERKLNSDYFNETPIYSFNTLADAECYLRYKTSPVNRAAAGYECVYEIRCKISNVGYNVARTYFAR